jgi:hypothetical protein
MGLEVRLIDRVQHRPQGFLNDAITQRGNAKWPRLSIAFRDVDAANGLGLIRFPLQVINKDRYLLIMVILEIETGLSIDPRRRASRPRQHRIGGTMNPVVPVHQTIQVGKPVMWILLRGFRQSHLLLGHHCSVHTSSLRLSSQRLALSLTAFLRQVVGSPHRRLLRRLRPLSDIGRRLTDSRVGETDRVPRFTWGASTHGHRFCLYAWLGSLPRS